MPFLETGRDCAKILAVIADYRTQGIAIFFFILFVFYVTGTFYFLLTEKQVSVFKVSNLKAHAVAFSSFHSLSSPWHQFSAILLFSPSAFEPLLLSFQNLS